MVLIGFAIGWREAAVTAVVIPTTILLTLFASNLMGYTINRVSLFALIFSIGILVDDAIVMIENIARHWAMNDGRSRVRRRRRGRRRGRQSDRRRHPDRGHRPAAHAVRVRADGSLHGADPGQRFGGDGVLLLRRRGDRAVADGAIRRAATLSGRPAPASRRGQLGRLYRRVAAPRHRAPRKSAWTFLIGSGWPRSGRLRLFATKTVTVKLLPFDNKSELQVVLNMPEGTSLEDTQRALCDAAAASPRPCRRSRRSTPMPERPRRSISTAWCVITICAKARDGRPSVELAPKDERHRNSHAIALDLRQRLAGLDPARRRGRSRWSRRRPGRR